MELYNAKENPYMHEHVYDDVPFQLLESDKMMNQFNKWRQLTDRKYKPNSCVFLVIEIILS